MAALAPEILAQETRTEQLEQQRAERARQVQPEPRTKIENTLLYLDEHRLLQRMFSPEAGFYPQIGSVTTGGGFAFGGGYRKPFANDNLLFNTNAAFTLRGYRSARVELSLPRLVRQTVEVTGRFRYRYFPQEDFYGIGPDSQKGDRTNYLIEEAEYAIQIGWRPRRWLLLASQNALLNPRIGSGTDTLFPTTEARFSEATAPGLTDQPNFLENGGLAEIDYRDSRGNPRSGGRYVAYVSRFDDRDNHGFDFSRITATVEQYVPIFDKKRVFAFRIAANDLDPAAGSMVPFYYIYPLGGKDTIRGFNDLRFRDTSAWLFNTEYRWEAFSGLDMALFYDRGDVAPRFEELSLRDAKDSYGLGFRFGTNESVFIRAEIAFGSDEGTRYYVAFSGPLRLERFLR
jgi:Omp85 superfamily domain